MANRNTFNGSSTDVPWPNVGMPEGFGDQYARHIKTLYDVAAFPLTDIGGTADDVTATLDPDLDSGGLVDGMKFTLTWASNNTGPMTLALNGGAAVDVLQADGSVMIADAAKAGTRVLLEYIGGDFRLIGGGSGAGSVEPYYTAITASTTWTKPAGFPDEAIVEIEAWGGGGGGGKGNPSYGGGGGAYKKFIGRYMDIPSSLAVVIGAGGAGATSVAGVSGGDTTVGSLLTAYGGALGTTTASGRGGGTHQSGSSGGLIGGGASVSGSQAHASNLWAGGGGGVGGAIGDRRNGGMSVYGGGGGGGGGLTSGGGSPTTEGTSIFAGSGGAGTATTNGGAGTAPGGGGGGTGSGTAAGAGARGEVRIRIYG